MRTQAPAQWRSGTAAAGSVHGGCGSRAETGAVGIEVLARPVGTGLAMLLHNQSMRVSGGEFRSRRLKSLPGESIRPTPDRLRESLFNILAPQIRGSVFVDAYAGTGAVGIEALSRGAESAIFLEKNRDAVELLEENLQSLGITNRARVMRGSAHLLLPRHAKGIVFLDPPYSQVTEYEMSMAALGDMMPELVIVQHSSKLELAEAYGGLQRYRVVKQGDNSLSFYGAQE